MNSAVTSVMYKVGVCIAMVMENIKSAQKSSDASFAERKIRPSMRSTWTNGATQPMKDIAFDDDARHGI